MNDQPLNADTVLAHTICEGGEWQKGYAPNWVVAVMRSGAVFDRAYQRISGKLLRGTFDADELAHIENVINGRWRPCELLMADDAHATDRTQGFTPLPPLAKPVKEWDASRTYPAAHFPLVTVRRAHG